MVRRSGYPELLPAFLVALQLWLLLPPAVQPCGHHVVHKDIQRMVAQHLAHQHAHPLSGAWGLGLDWEAAATNGKGAWDSRDSDRLSLAASAFQGSAGDSSAGHGSSKAPYPFGTHVLAGRQVLDNTESNHHHHHHDHDHNPHEVHGGGHGHDHAHDHDHGHGHKHFDHHLGHEESDTDAGDEAIEAWNARDWEEVERVVDEQGPDGSDVPVERRRRAARLQRRMLQQGSVPSPGPLRLNVTYQLLDELDASQQLVLTRVVEAVRRILQKFILVKRPPTGGLLVDPRCTAWSNYGCLSFYPDIARRSPDPEDRLCGLATVLPEHVVKPDSCNRRVRLADVFNLVNGVSGPASGAGNGSSAYGSGCSSYAGTGGEPTDMYLYITAVQNEDCQAGAAAWAKPCALDLGNNRPLMGAANICPGALALLSEDTLTAVLAHEMIHALGFTDGMFNLTRRPDGSPRPYSEIVSQATVGGVKVNRLVTPGVRDAARAHFGCPSLQGAQLEEEGSAGSAGSHWEYNHFQGEVMVASTIFAADGSPPALSNLTLSYLEDTGWYLANRSAMGLLSWATGTGCLLPQSSCKQYMAAVPDQDLFCDPATAVSGDGSPALRCSSTFKATGVCRTLNFTGGCGLLVSNNNEETCISGLDNKLSLPDVFGWGSGLPSSRCFPVVFRFQASVSRNRYTFPASGRDGDAEAACFDTVCSSDGSKVYVKMLGQQFECPEGQYLNLPQLLPDRYTAGRIGPCPPASTLCATQTCAPGTCNSNGGECLDGRCYCRLAYTGADCSFNLISGQSIPDNSGDGTGNGTAAPPPPPRAVWTQVVQLTLTSYNNRSDFFTRSDQFKAVLANWCGLDVSRVRIASIAAPLGTSGTATSGASSASGAPGTLAGQSFDGTSSGGRRRDRRRQILQTSPSSPPPPPTLANAVVTSLITPSTKDATAALVSRLMNASQAATLASALAAAGFMLLPLPGSLEVQTLLTQVTDSGSPPAVTNLAAPGDESSSSSGHTAIIVAIAAGGVAVVGIVVALISVLVIRSRRARREQYAASAAMAGRRAQQYAIPSGPGESGAGASGPLAAPPAEYKPPVAEGLPYPAAPGYPAAGPPAGATPWPVPPQYGTAGGVGPEAAAYSYYSARAAAMSTATPPQSAQQQPYAPAPLYSGPQYGAYR